MNAKVDQFCDKLRNRLDTVEGRLKAVKTNMKALPGQAEKALRDKLDEARTKIQAQKERIEQTRANLKARAQLGAIFFNVALVRFRKTIRTMA